MICTPPPLHETGVSVRCINTVVRRDAQDSVGRVRQNVGRIKRWGRATVQAVLLNLRTLLCLVSVFTSRMRRKAGIWARDIEACAAACLDSCRCDLRAPGLKCRTPYYINKCARPQSITCGRLPVNYTVYGEN